MERDFRLEHRLSLLQARGQRHLTGAMRRVALARAIGRAMPTTVVPPLLFLGWAMVGRPGTTLVIVACVASPLLVAAIACAMRTDGGAADRSAALALFDRHLHAKDRIAAADQFVRLDRRTGFQSAALNEAEPWIDRAVAEPLAPPPSPLGAVWRRWPFVVAAVLTMAAAILLQRPLSEQGDVTRPAGIARMLARTRTALTAAGAAAGLPVTVADRVAENRAAAGRSADGGDAATAADAAAAGRSGTAGTASSAAGAGAASGSPTGRPAGDDPTQAEAAGRQAAGRARGAGEAGAGTGTGDGSAMELAAEGGGDAAAPETGAAAALRRGSPPGAGGAGASPPAAAPPGQRRPATQDGKGEQQQPDGRSQPGDRGNSQPGNGNGQDRNGDRGAADGSAKKSRGVSGLLLAVPMQDRLTGTPNPGRSSSMTRPGPLQAMDAARVAAANRGVQNGDAGRSSHRAATPQESRLLGTLFRRGGTVR